MYRERSRVASMQFLDSRLQIYIDGMYAAVMALSFFLSFDAVENCLSIRGCVQL